LSIDHDLFPRTAAVDSVENYAVEKLKGQVAQEPWQGPEGMSSVATFAVDSYLKGNSKGSGDLLEAVDGSYIYSDYFAVKS